MKERLFTFFKGVAVGLANIIPGVSGGTMALILGIYERLLNDISQINVSALQKILGIVSRDKARRAAAIAELKRLDVPFLLLLAIGAGVAILALAKVMTILLTAFHDPTYGFFFGLVLASVIVPWQLIKRRKVAVFIMAFVGIGVGAGSDFLMSKESKINSAEQKAAIKVLKAERAQAIAGGDAAKSAEIENKLAAIGNKESSLLRYALYLAAGAIAISAMILPGISGSFLLLAMGLYFDILNALSSYNIPIILVFGLGCLIGLLAFSRFLNFLLKHFSDETMGFLSGLMVGSLWTIWPFREKHIIAAGTPFAETLYLSNIFPASLGLNELLTLFTAVLGVAMVSFFLIYEKRHKKAPREA